MTTSTKSKNGKVNQDIDYQTLELITDTQAAKKPIINNYTIVDQINGFYVVIDGQEFYGTSKESVVSIEHNVSFKYATGNVFIGDSETKNFEFLGILDIDGLKFDDHLSIFDSNLTLLKSKLESKYCRAKTLLKATVALKNKLENLDKQRNSRKQTILGLSKK